MAQATEVGGRTFPRQAKLTGGREATLRLMTRADRDAMLALARGLPQDDLLFLRMDITEPRVVDQWLANIDADRTVTVLAASKARRETGREPRAGRRGHQDNIEWHRAEGDGQRRLRAASGIGP